MARLGREGKHPASATHAKKPQKTKHTPPKKGEELFKSCASGQKGAGVGAGRQSSQPSTLEHFPSSNPGSRFQFDGLIAEPSWVKSWAGLAQGTFRAKADIAA